MNRWSCCIFSVTFSWIFISWIWTIYVTGHENKSELNSFIVRIGRANGDWKQGQFRTSRKLDVVNRTHAVPLAFIGYTVCDMMIEWISDFNEKIVVLMLRLNVIIKAWNRWLTYMFKRGTEINLTIQLKWYFSQWNELTMKIT